MLALAAVGCSSDGNLPPPPADLANLNLGASCSEYHGVDPADVGGVALSGTLAGPCRPTPGNMACAVCRGASAVGLEEIGVHTVDHYYYGVSESHCLEQFADSRKADECVAIQGGVFEPRFEGLRGPSGVSAPKLDAGKPNPELGAFIYSVRRLELRGGEAVELSRCSNFYGAAFEPGLDRVRDACPDASRCTICVSHGQDGGATFESIHYRSALDPDLCGKTLAAADPDGCVQYNRGVLVIASD